jgi:hypothetical protein
LRWPIRIGIDVACTDVNGPVGGFQVVGDGESLGARLSVLLEALPDVPKPVVQLMDSYLRRLPADLIAALWRDVVRSSSWLEMPSDLSDSDWNRTHYATDTISLCAFSDGTGLQTGLYTGRYVRTGDSSDDGGTFPMKEVDASELARWMRTADRLTGAIQRVLSSDPGALCLLVAPKPAERDWCSVLLAVPDCPGTAVANLVAADGTVPVPLCLKSLFTAAEPVYGLIVDEYESTLF